MHSGRLASFCRFAHSSLLKYQQRSSLPPTTCQLRNVLLTAESPSNFHSTGLGKAKGPGPSGPEGSSSGSSITGKGKLDPPSNVFRSYLPNPLGPGASSTGKYKNPEYFSYHRESYFEMEIVMAKLRVPQPVAIAKKQITTPAPKLDEPPTAIVGGALTEGKVTGDS